MVCYAYSDRDCLVSEISVAHCSTLWLCVLFQRDGPEQGKGLVWIISHCLHLVISWKHKLKCLNVESLVDSHSHFFLLPCLSNYFFDSSFTFNPIFTVSPLTLFISLCYLNFAFPPSHSCAILTVSLIFFIM